MGLRALRMDRGWSQDELAQISDLSVRTIQRIESGRPAGVETLKALATAFRMDAAELRVYLDKAEAPKTMTSYNDILAQYPVIADFIHLASWHLAGLFILTAVLGPAGEAIAISETVFTAGMMIWLAVFFLQWAIILFRDRARRGQGPHAQSE